MSYEIPTLFPAQPDQRDLGGRRRMLNAPYRYVWAHDGLVRRITVPRGFCHDSASVPRLFWTFMDPHSLDRAAVFHDVLYRHGGLLPAGMHETMAAYGWVDSLTRPDGSRMAWTRSEADRLFFRMLREDPDGPGRIRRRLAYRAVARAGKGSWRAPDASMERTFEVPWERAA